MAGVDVGDSGSKKRSTNSEINMIPFIDLLMVTIAFLLITAVWVTNSRLNTNAEVPAQAGCGDDCQPAPKTLHVHVNHDRFVLAWKDGATLVSEQSVARPATDANKDGAPRRYDDLAAAVRKEWEASGLHRDASDRAVDRAVLHTDDGAPFSEVVAVLDAISSARREVHTADGRTLVQPAFATTFAVR